MSLNSNFSLWPILPFGADDGDGTGNDGNQGGSGNNQNNQGGQQNSGNGQQQNQGGAGGNQSSDDDDSDDPYAGLSSKELKRLLKDEEKKGKTAEDARKALQDKADADERKKNDENTNLKKDLEQRDTEIGTLKAALSQQAIQNAIRNDTRFEWKNTEIVAQQLNPEIVKVDSNGKVEGLAKELLRISKDESLKFLLAKDNTQQNQNGNQNGNQQQQQQNNGQTGFQPGQGGANNGGGVGPNAKELAELMPALRSRI